MAEEDNKPAKKTPKRNSPSMNICKKHDITKADITKFQKDLLNWYDKNQRVLPWRDIAKHESDPDKRGYAVWVSEIMLQQTQVATVISYFNKWMKNWPTVSDLAAATLEDVNKVWAGLGYYSRARRLHEGANIVVEKLNGSVPQNVQELMKLIPGVGQYSASAIASVAFQKPVGVVDGNVIRVLSRMRIIAASSNQPDVRNHLWDIANKIVSVKRPGDFNQALMELGAVVCTPQNPKCVDCPVSNYCYAYLLSQADSKVKKLDSFLERSSRSKAKSVPKFDIPDIEDAARCSVCIEPSVWKENPQVTAYPVKVEKKSSRIERVGVVVIKKGDSYLMTKRPEKGLLAGLWEFPSVTFVDNLSDKENTLTVDSLLSDFGVPLSMVAKRKYIKEILHIFSHIRATYVVEYLEINSCIEDENVPKEISWLTEDEIRTSAVSTAMKKVFEAVKNRNENGNKASYSGIIEEALAKSAAKRKSTIANTKNKSIRQTSLNVNITNKDNVSSISEKVLKPISNTNKELKMSSNSSGSFTEVSDMTRVSDVASETVKNSDNTINLSSPDLEKTLAASSSRKKVLETVKNTNKRAKTDSSHKNGEFESSSKMSTDIVIEYEGFKNSGKVKETVPNVPAKKIKKSSSLRQPSIKSFFKQK